MVSHIGSLSLRSLCVPGEINGLETYAIRRIAHALLLEADHLQPVVLQQDDLDGQVCITAVAIPPISMVKPPLPISQKIIFTPQVSACRPEYPWSCRSPVVPALYCSEPPT